MGTHKFFEEIAESDVANLVTDLAGKQPLDSDLTAVAAISPSNDDLIQRKSGAWTNRTPAQLKTDLALTASDVGLGSVNNTSDAGKPVSTAQQTALDGKQNLDSDLTAIAGLTATTDNVIQSVSSAWASRTPAQLKTTLSLAKGDVGLGNVDNVQQQPLDSDLTTIAGLTATTDSILQSKASAWTTRTPAQLKTDLVLVKADVGLGSVDNTADTAKPVSTAQQTALDGKQNLDSDLTTIAGLTATTDSILQSKASAWTTRTPAQFKTDLALVKADVGLGSVDNLQQQPIDSDLTTIASLTATTDSILQSKASAWTTRTPAQFKTDLALVKADVGLGSVDNLQQQPIDADLTTIAGLTATTDNFLQSKASAWASRTPTQVAADLVTPLSSSLQPLDSDLTTIAGLTATTDSFLQAKGSAWSARTIAQVRTDLNQVKPYPPVTLTPGTTPALDASLGTHFRLAMAQSATIGIPSNPTDGQVIVIEATSDATPRTLSLNTGTGGFRFGTDITALTIHVASKTDYVQAVYRTSTNKWDVIAYIKGF